MNAATGIVFIGDEADASGYRLAGAQTICPEPGETWSILQSLLAKESIRMIVLSATHASRLDSGYLADLMTGLAPLIVVVSPMQQPTAATDLQDSLYSLLGIHPSDLNAVQFT